MKNTPFLTLAILATLTLTGPVRADQTNTNAGDWLSRPLSVADTLNIALAQNAAILKAKNDLEGEYGLVVQTRAIALPQVQATGKYTDTEITAIQSFPGAYSPAPNQNWSAGVQITQSIYQGGRLHAAIQAAKATEKQAVAQYDSTVADTLLSVRLAYYDVLLAAQEITVH